MRPPRRIVLLLALTAAVGLAPTLLRGAQEPSAGATDRVQVRTLPVQKNVHVIIGAGANVTVQVNNDGLLLVDTGLGSLAPQVLAELRRLSPRPVSYIINTTASTDHTGGNALLSGLRPGTQRPIVLTGLAPILAHENVMKSMTSGEEGQAAPANTWPTETFFESETSIFFNDEPIQVFHAPAAHTDGDSTVLFRRSDVISTGDIFQTTTYPVIDLSRGGTLQGIIDALNHVIRLAVPARYQEGGTMIVPGHGRISDEADVVEYRDMLTIIRDRLQDGVAKGRTIEQMEAERPTRDYDRRWGVSSGAWTTRMFVQAAYASLKKTGGPR